MKTWFVVGVAVVAATGCELTPANLPDLYRARDTFQQHIDTVESKYKLAPREGAGWKSNELKEKVDSLTAMNRKLAEEKQALIDEWFKTLTQENQIAWMMHRDRLSVEWARVDMQDRVNRDTSEARWADLDLQARDQQRKLWMGDTVNVNVKDGRGPSTFVDMGTRGVLEIKGK